MKAAQWFGVGLAAGLLFLWCLVRQIEVAEIGGGWMWGIIVFGVVALVSLAIALAKFFGGGAATRTDPLMRRDGRNPLGRDGSGSNPFRETIGGPLQGTGGIPRGSSGRVLR